MDEMFSEKMIDEIQDRSYRKAKDQDKRRVVRPMNEMTEPEKAWVAGIVEGEGCLRFYDATAGRASTCVASVVVVMTDLDVIESLHRITGLGNVGENFSSGAMRERCKRKWRWAVTDRQGVSDLLNAITPFLHGRRGDKAETLLAGIERDLNWMRSRDLVFYKCGHNKDDENVGYRYDRRRNLDVPYCRTCQKEGRPPNKTDKKHRKYPWSDWMNGEIWDLEPGTDFTGDWPHFRTTLWGKAKRSNKKCLSRQFPNGNVRIMFVDSDTPKEFVSILDDVKICLAAGCGNQVLRKSSLAKFCSDECYLNDKDFNYKYGYAANPKRPSIL